MVGCDKTKVPNLVTCMRQVPTGKIIDGSHPRPFDAPFIPKMYPIMSWGPAIDNSKMGLSDLPLTLIKAGNWAKVPTIMGTNKDEGTIFVLMFPLVVPDYRIPLNEAQFNRTIQYFFDSRAPTVLANMEKYYPKASFKLLEGRAAALLRDYFFACPSRRLVRAAGAASPSRLYHFVYVGDFIEDPILGDYHSAELQFVFDNAWPPIVHIFTPRDMAVADAFGQYWTNFAYFGDPNGNGTSKLVKWPAYDNTKQNVLMDVAPKVADDSFVNVCQFWDSLGPGF